MTMLTAAKSAIIRCHQVLCPGMVTFFYVRRAEKTARLNANALDPWSCGRHPKERQRSAA